MNKILSKMDISLACRTLVNDRTTIKGIPPPAIMELSGMVSFEYKWLIPCTPQVTKVIWKHGSLINRRKQIEHLVGYAKLAILMNIYYDAVVCQCSPFIVFE